jgi:hypothetical protein
MQDTAGTTPVHSLYARSVAAAWALAIAFIAVAAGFGVVLDHRVSVGAAEAGQRPVVRIGTAPHDALERDLDFDLLTAETPPPSG